MTNLQKTENDEMKPKKQRRRNGFFNSILQLSPCTTLKLPKINFTSTWKRLKTLLDYWALIQSRKKYENRTVGKLYKTNMRGGLKLEPGRI